MLASGLVWLQAQWFPLGPYGRTMDGCRTAWDPVACEINLRIGRGASPRAVASIRAYSTARSVHEGSSARRHPQDRLNKALWSWEKAGTKPTVMSLRRWSVVLGVQPSALKTGKFPSGTERNSGQDRCRRERFAVPVRYAFPDPMDLRERLRVYAGLSPEWLQLTDYSAAVGIPMHILKSLINNPELSLKPWNTRKIHCHGRKTGHGCF